MEINEKNINIFIVSVILYLSVVSVILYLSVNFLALFYGINISSTQLKIPTFCAINDRVEAKTVGRVRQIRPKIGQFRLKIGGKIGQVRQEVREMAAPGGP